MEYNALFTKDKEIMFAFHGHPWLIHRLTYRRGNHRMHVRGYKEEGTITTAFDMTVKNELDRFHLVMDVIERTPINTPAARALHEKMQQKLVEHTNYITENGIDLPEVRNWEWPH
jgi:xylulose-5-phosphate/fructose-6-phosphate phosphoketolase